MKLVAIRAIATAASCGIAAVGLVACTTDVHRSEQRAVSPVRSLDAPLPAISDRTPSAETVPARFAVRPSINQLAVTGARPASKVGLFDRANHHVADRIADDQGSIIFRELPAGPGYLVQAFDGTPAETSERVTVPDEAQSLPEQSFYAGQRLDPGFGYVTTRDGTKLSAAVYLPGPPEKGPYPTVVEYSGYDPSNPTSSRVRPGITRFGFNPDELCPTFALACENNEPAQPSSLMALALGYAVVGVNIRGTGCSGGAFDFFEKLQVTDGYDVIETVAAQPWVKGNKVGMVGLSYPGISQLFVAAARPPHLAAIAPLSVFDDSVRGVLSPGGLYNDGFAFQWVKRVGERSKPFGDDWVREVADGGDATCASNMALRLQGVDQIERAKRYTYYPPDIADPLNPSLFVDRIEVPVFLSGSWQDNQTGGRFANLLDRFTNAPVKRFIAFNGAHADGYAPHVLVEMKAFLDLYVAGQLTDIAPFASAIIPQFLATVFDQVTPLPPQRLDSSSDYQTARREYEAEPELKVVFEVGGGATPGNLEGRFAAEFESWPPAATATPFYFQPDATLTSTPPTDASSSSKFLHDPDLAQKSTLPGDKGRQEFAALPDYEWDQEEPGRATVFVTAPLTDDLVVIGNSSADLWIRSTEPDADVGVTVSEVRPDNRETFVQSGLLRARMRKLAPGSTELHPLHTGFESDAAPLSTQDWNEARVEMFPVAHIFRKGSRIRVSVHTPGGDRPTWTYVAERFATPPPIWVAHEAAHPSRLVLPAVSGVTGYPADLPACPGLRGQPCRDAVPFINLPG